MSQPQQKSFLSVAACRAVRLWFVFLTTSLLRQLPQLYFADQNTDLWNLKAWLSHLVLSATLVSGWRFADIEGQVFYLFRLRDASLTLICITWIVPEGEIKTVLVLATLVLCWVTAWLSAQASEKVEIWRLLEHSIITQAVLFLLARKRLRGSEGTRRRE